MNKWRFTIEGYGNFYNPEKPDSEGDANFHCEKLVRELQNVGQNISKATFSVVGHEENLLKG